MPIKPKIQVATVIGTIITVVTTADWVISKIEVGDSDVKITQRLPHSINIQVSEAYKLFFVIEYKFENSCWFYWSDEWIFFEYVILFDGKIVANERIPKNGWIKDRDAYSKPKIELWLGAKEWDCDGYNNDHTVEVIAMMWDDGSHGWNPDEPSYPHHIKYNYNRYLQDPTCKMNPHLCVPRNHRNVARIDEDKDEMKVFIHNPFYITNQKSVTKRTHDGDNVSLSFDAKTFYKHLSSLERARPLKAEITIDPLNDKDNWDFEPEPTSQTWDPPEGHKESFKFEGVHKGPSHPGVTITYDDEYSLKAKGNTTFKVEGEEKSFSWKTWFTKEYDKPNTCLPDSYYAECTTPEDTEPPTIKSTVPKNGDTNVSVETNISITFSEAMNKTSVEDAIMIYPMPEISYTTVSWEGDDTIILTPIPYLYYMQSYEVSVDTKAKDLASNHLEEPYKFYFTTEEYPVL